jgi:hypothetical protein
VLICGQSLCRLWEWLDFTKVFSQIRGAVAGRFGPPPLKKGYVLRRVPAHPFVVWLARWLPIEPYLDVEVPMTRCDFDRTGANHRTAKAAKLDL